MSLAGMHELQSTIMQLHSVLRIIYEASLGASRIYFIVLSVIRAAIISVRFW